ncbi:MAG: DnaJ domain-containing protein [Alphaproteobacteria bacterium]|nr:DnaJ domain-containing protein [Alphaproteobacteria bacterium]
MGNFVIAAAIVIGGWWLIRQFANAQPAQVRGLVRKVAGIAILVFAGFMAMRGGINLAIPLFVLGLGLLGQNIAFPGGIPWGGSKTPGQKSRVTTQVLSMELDHDSGEMDGEILSGPLKGRKLSSLGQSEIRSVHETCVAASDQSRALFEAWLDRSRAGWREAWGGNSQQSPLSHAGPMGRKEALAVLGLQDGATIADIRAAHRRLMKEFHPDRGGSDYLAAKINEAKDVLVQDRGATT